MFERRSPWGAALRLMVVAACSSALIVGCTKDSPTEIAPPEDPPEPSISETFTGSIVQSGRSCHFFTLVESGNMILTLTELTPLATLTVGMGIGQPDDARTCILGAQDASVNVLDMLLAAGTGGLEYCACVLDVGNIFPDQTVEYVLRVDHT